MVRLSLIVLSALLGADDKAADEALVVFREAYKGSVAERAAAVTTLARTEHARILAKLSGILAGEDADVRKAAALGLGEWKDQRPKVAAVLVGTLAPNGKMADVQEAIFRALGMIRESSALPTIHKYFGDEDAKVAGAAVEAAGAIGSRDSIDPILDLMKECEKRLNMGTVGGRGRIPGGGGLGAGGVRVPGGGKDPQRLRAEALKPVTIKAMQAITKENYSVYDDWVAWWKRNRASFKGSFP